MRKSINIKVSAFLLVALFVAIAFVLSSSLISACDSASPAVAMFLGESPGVHNDIIYSFGVYATLWNNDCKGVVQCQIDWGEGSGWQEVGTGVVRTWYAMLHTYSSLGTKTIKYRCKNQDGLWSSGNIQHDNYDIIEIQDITPPAVSIYLGESALVHNNATYSKKIYANLWNQDSQTNVTQCRINWNDGSSWEDVSAGTEGSWYSLSHTYSTIGIKTVSYECKNEASLWSAVSSDTIELLNTIIPPQNQTNQTNQTSPVITILSPINGYTYNITNISLDATSNQAITTWIYNLNNAGNVTLLSMPTIVTAQEGNNNLIVYGINENGTGFSSINFIANTTITNPPSNDTNNTGNNTTNDTTAPLISSISVNPSINSVSIMWTTDENSTSKIYYGKNTSLGSYISSISLVTSHSVSLTGLTSSTLYYYKVESCDVSGNCANSSIGNFTTKCKSNNDDNENDRENNGGDNAHDYEDEIIKLTAGLSSQNKTTAAETLRLTKTNLSFNFEILLYILVIAVIIVLIMIAVLLILRSR
jgi:hypothetical protein